MASGDRTRLTWYSELETTNINVTTVTEDVTDLKETVSATTTGLVDRVTALETSVTALEEEPSTEITITAIYGQDTTMAVAGATDGYYIFIEEPTDKATYFNTGIVNDIWKCESSVWETYLSYGECDATVAVATTVGTDEVTYQKSEGSWIEVGTGSGASGITVKGVYASGYSVSSVTAEGYYTWTSALPSDYTNYFSDGNIAAGDILYYDGDSWELYISYDSAPASIYHTNGITYEKYEGGWVDYKTFITSSTNEKLSSVVYLWEPSSSTTIGASSIIPFATSEDTFNNGDDPISNSAGVITLPAGYLYELTAYAGESSGSSGSGFYIHNNTSGEQIGFIGQMSTTAQTANANTFPAFGRLDLTDETDNVTVSVVLMNSGTFDAYVDAARFVVIVKQMNNDVTKIVPVEDIELTNEVSEESYLVGNDDGTATWVSTAVAYYEAENTSGSALSGVTVVMDGTDSNFTFTSTPSEINRFKQVIYNGGFDITWMCTFDVDAMTVTIPSDLTLYSEDTLAIGIQ